jgi:hypothetical protein
MGGSGIESKIVEKGIKMLTFAWADRLHSQVVRWTLLHYFTAMTRLLLAVGFIIPSLPKILDRPFTLLSTDTAVGYYFDALHRAGVYYQFIGYGQLLAGLLLLIPWTAPLGAFVYFPIILNIFVLTVGINFRGTEVVTGLMLLGNLYLLGWDYDRWRGILPRWRPTQRRLHLQGYLFWGFLGGLGATFAYVGLAYLHVAMLHQAPLSLMATVIASGVIFGMALYWHALRLEIRPEI